MVLAEDLRKAVLQYAVEGKLTKQLSTDSDVDELIVKIKEEKTELEKRKKARKEAPYPEISDDEKEFEIPENWRWIRLGEIGVYKKGPFGSALTKSIFVPKSEDAVKVYEQKNAIQKDASLGDYYITREYYDEKMSGFTLESGDIIVSCAGTIGETYIMPENIELGIINQALMRMNIAQSINIDYFLIYFDHILKKNAKRNSNGSAIKNIPPFEIFKKMLLPLPPVEEQERIVQRLKEVMKEIDEYSNMEIALLQMKKVFPLDMKKSVLQASLQGKLTKQNLDDISIVEYLSLNNIIAINEEDYPYDIPPNWQFVKMRDIVSIPIRRGKTPKYVDKSNTLVFAQKCNKKEGYVSFEEAKYLDESILKKYDADSFLQAGDIVINSTGGGTLGRIGYITEELVANAFPIVPDTHVTTIRLKPDINKKYILGYLRYYQSYLESKGVGSTNQTELRPEVIEEMFVPMPPIEEQQRIVDKLNQILPLCDDLKV